jgi:hypothetical protein
MCGRRLHECLKISQEQEMSLSQSSQVEGQESQTKAKMRKPRMFSKERTEYEVVHPVANRPRFGCYSLVRITSLYSSAGSIQLN